jgi:hypothetical protein
VRAITIAKNGEIVIQHGVCIRLEFSLRSENKNGTRDISWQMLFQPIKCVTKNFLFNVESSVSSVNIRLKRLRPKSSVENIFKLNLFMGSITGIYFPILSVVLGFVVDDDRHESGARWFNAQKTRHILSVATVYTMGAGRGMESKRWGPYDK